jgi:hypothetical protein
LSNQNLSFVDLVKVAYEEWLLKADEKDKDTHLSLGEIEVLAEKLWQDRFSEDSDYFYQAVREIISSRVKAASTLK